MPYCSQKWSSNQKDWKQARKEKTPPLHGRVHIVLRYFMSSPDLLVIWELNTALVGGLNARYATKYSTKKRSWIHITKPIQGKRMYSVNSVGKLWHHSGVCRATWIYTPVKKRSSVTCVAKHFLRILDWYTTRGSVLLKTTHKEVFEAHHKYAIWRIYRTLYKIVLCKTP